MNGGPRLSRSENNRGIGPHFLRYTTCLRSTREEKIMSSNACYFSPVEMGMFMVQKMKRERSSQRLRLGSGEYFRFITREKRARSQERFESLQWYRKLCVVFFIV